MKRFVLGVIAIGFFATPASAEAIFLNGTIGKAPVFASLNRSGDSIIGSYLYLKYGKEIEMSGKIDKSGVVHLDESSFDTTKKSGNFDGHIANGAWTGTWTNATGGTPLPFAFTEFHEMPAKFSGDFKCDEHHTDKKYGYKYSRSARVTFVNGALTHMDLVQNAESADGDSQDCSIGLSDLERKPGGPGVVLRGKDDAPGGDGPHCTIHVIANANFVYVSPGDLNEDYNDCKGAADVMFCSTHANFGDFLIDKSGVCKPAD
jgi:hypothetical protein